MKYYTTIKELVDATCDNFFDREAFIFKTSDGYERKLFGEFKEDYYHLAKNLVKDNIINTHIALLAKTSYSGLVGLFGSIITSNTVIIPDCNFTNDTMEALFTRTDVEILIYDDEFIEKAEEIANASKVIKKTISIQNLLRAEVNNDVLFPEQKQDQDAIILFTSGTTGHSKAVVLTNENICTNAYASAANYDAEEVAKIIGNTSIAILPIHHSMFLVFVLTLMQEAMAVYFNTDITRLMEDLKIIRPCTLTVVPALIEQIYNDVMKKSQQMPGTPISKILREVTGGRLYGMSCGSAKLNPKYIKAFWDWGIVISEGYGMTEASPSIAINNYKNFKIGSVGKPLPGIEVKIVDGEIWTRSKCVMKGYYKDEESTKEVLTDGWLKTGDLGYLDEEGYLFITGRIKNLIILSNGENISPEELETLLNREEIISESQVYEANGIIVAEIFNRKWKEYDIDFLWSKVKTSIHNVNRQLPAYKKLQSFKIRKNPFPRNRMQKIMRSDLGKSDYLEEPKIAYRKAESIAEQKLIEIFESKLNIKGIAVTDKFFEIGGDSLLARRVVNAIEDEMNVKISINDIFEHQTAAELAELIKTLEPTKFSKIEEVEARDYYPMSALQKRMYHIFMANWDSVSYNIPVFCQLSKMPDLDKLKSALVDLSERHEIMRTTFHNWGSEYVQQIHEEAVVDFLYEESDHEFEALAEEFVKPFNLEQLPLLRTKIVKAGEKIYFMLDIHHIISDGTSIYLLFRELSDLYGEKELIPVKQQYRNYSEWMRTEREGEIGAQKDYWLDRFKEDVPILDLPMDYTRPQYISTQGKSKLYRIDKVLSNSILEYSLTTGNTLYTVLLSSLMCLFSKYAGQEDLVIGTPVAGRTKRETEDMLGMFVNTLALRAYPDKTKTYKAFLKEVKEDYIRALGNQEYPFDLLVEELNLRWDITRNPLFDLMFILQNEEAPEGMLGDIQMSFLQKESLGTQCDLLVEARESLGEISLYWKYRSDLFKETTIDQFAEHLMVFLKSILYDDSLEIGKINILTEKDKEIIASVNDTKISYNEKATLTALFEHQVISSAQTIAIKCGEEQLNYKELNIRANRIANTLRASGVRRGDVVPILGDRSVNLFAGILGILKSGAAYLPLDPEYPQDRIKYMLDHSEADLVLTEDSFIEKLPKICRIISLSVCLDEEIDSNNPTHVNESNDLAYVLYTSGSTGKPKGVMIEHRQVVNFIKGMELATAITDYKNIISLTTVSFDIFGLESLLPLTKGMTVTMSKSREDLDSDSVAALIIRDEIQVIQSTPSRYKLLLQRESFKKAMKTIKLALVGGETFPEDLLEELREYEGLRIMNVYGPTEATIWSSVKDVTARISQLTIGKPIANTRFYIIDDNKNLLPVGMRGELCIAGDGVGRGYYKADDLTAERFITLSNGDRVYRTGDLAYLLPHGDTQCLGRMDYQVKIRGYRIELGEIETTLLGLSGIKSAAVIAFGETGEKELCAYYVADEEIDMTIIKDELGKTLPPYMVPGYFVPLASLPLTPNGKINKKALPAPEKGERVVTEYVAPETETEKMISIIFAEILGINKIGLYDDFFDLGGHSLKAVRLVNALEEKTGIRFTINDVFLNSTVQKLSILISYDTENYEKIPKTEEKDYYPMSSPQQRTFLISQMDATGIAYNIPFGLKIYGTLDVDAIRTTLQTIIDRHEILRSEFLLMDGKPVQTILPAVKVDFTYRNISSENLSNENMEEALMKDFVRPFVLSKAPLFRAELIVDRDTNYLLFDMHHIVSDGTSLNIVINEFYRIYSGEKLKPLPCQYKDYSEWMLARDFSSQKEFWMKEFGEDIPVLDMPTDFPRPQMQNFRGKIASLDTGKELGRKIKALAKKYGATEYMVLLSCAMVLISKYSRQEDMVILSPISGRVHKDTEGMIGMFINTLAMRGRPEKNKTFLSFLEEMKDYCLQAYENQEYPFEELVDAVGVKSGISQNQLFNIMLILHNEQEMPKPEEAQLDIIENKDVSAKFDITFNITEYDDNFKLNLEYSIALYRKESAEGIAAHYIKLLESITEDENVILNNIQMMTAADHEILRAVNDTRIPYEEGATLAELFERQVTASPDRIAVKCNEEELSYRELNKRANRIANKLRVLGVNPGDIIPILVDRSVNLFAGILGILKSGAAYLPLDPEYPEERIGYMLDHSKAKMVLTEENLQNKLPEEKITLLMSMCTDESNSCLNPSVINESKDLAYVLYTSGSTGKPKGVMIEHRQIVNFIKGMELSTDITSYSKIICLTTVSFDIFGLESLLPLTRGMTVTMTRSREDMDSDAVANLILREGIEVIQSTPSRFKLLLQGENFRKAFETIKLALVGGEAFPEDLLKDLREYAGLRIINVYGPTETTIWSSVKDVTAKGSNLTIGKPIANTRFYILDDERNILPVGIKGELCIGGDGVGRGYFNAEDLTTERFITLSNGDRAYRTGDLAYIRYDKDIEFLGRMDYQVKIRGYRVELGEIENALSIIEGMKYVAVTAFGNTAEKELCAYYVSDKELEISSLREELGKTLTAYMIPSYFVRLDEMPFTPNGKINRKALPEPEKGSRITIDYMAPTTEAERIICEIFEVILGVDKVGIHHDFFELGGHSLLVVLLSKEMKKYFQNYELLDVFTYQSPAKLAAYLTDNIISEAAMVMEDDYETHYIGEDSRVECWTDTIHKLPVTYPVITSFNHHAHLLSILGAYPHTNDWVMRNYILLYLHKHPTNSFFDFYFPVPNEVKSCEICPWILSQKISSETFTSMNLDILDFLCDMIDNHNYIHMMINYYHVKQCQYYHKEKYYHDVMVHGYDKSRRVFYCSDFIFSQTQKYLFSEIDFDEFAKGFHDALTDERCDYFKGLIYLYQVKPEQSIVYGFNLANVIHSIEHYYDSQIPEYWYLFNNQDDLEPKAFGLNVYDHLGEYILNAVAINQEMMDIRLFNILYDHKRIMNLRIDFLMKQDSDDKKDLYITLGEKYEKLEKSVKEILFSVLDYDMKNDLSITDRAIGKLKEAKVYEKEALHEFLTNYKKNN